MAVAKELTVFKRRCWTWEFTIAHDGYTAPLARIVVGPAACNAQVPEHRVPAFVVMDVDDWIVKLVDGPGIDRGRGRAVGIDCACDRDGLPVRADHELVVRASGDPDDVAIK